MKREIVWFGSLVMMLGGAAIFGACGSDNGAGGDGGDGGNGDGTIANDGAGLPDASTFPCDGCAPFPPLGTATCSPPTLGPADARLPARRPAPAAEHERARGAVRAARGRDALRGRLQERASPTCASRRTCNPVTRVRGGTSRGCGLTLPQAAWNDIANTNRDGDPVKVTVRATIDGAAASRRRRRASTIIVREGRPHRRHLLLAVGDLRRHRRQDGRHLQPRLRHVRPDADALLHVGRPRAPASAATRSRATACACRSRPTIPTPTTSSAT